MLGVNTQSVLGLTQAKQIGLEHEEKQDQRSLPWPGDLDFKFVSLGWSWLLFVLVCLG